jgi:predicted HTH transcriptional regulator
VEKRRYSRIRRTTKQLLLAGESQDVDFKKVVDGLHNDDLIAFANTLAGGTIIIGVEETGERGSRRSTLVGTDYDDSTILKILNRANSCLPPVPVEIIVENTTAKPIIVVQVSGRQRPHCSQKGTYLVRDGSRNRALHPQELLNIFLESEANTFANRFSEAAETIRVWTH